MLIRIRGFDDHKLEKIYSCEINYIFLIKNEIYLSQGLHKGRSTPSYRRSLYPSKENIQNFKTCIFAFMGHFSPPGSGSGAGSTTLVHMVK
jgi:hypothetical protein